ncbi:MAG: 4-aminobutyrate aminotransferase-like enzyme/Ser/Thr protein kinase RdoA (MazF antagonist) [Planctomycetota bacterium]|jgi:4-aminobutyrate aminotransferase-like enzyme/Ser/Thr protein kinase RdoA (MazF antagonist)
MVSIISHRMGEADAPRFPLACEPAALKTATVTTADFLAANESILLQLLEREHGLTGQLTPLPGEHDANLRLTDGDRSWLVKVGTADSDRELIDMQVAAFEHAAQQPRTWSLPVVVRTGAGVAVAEVETTDGSRPLWITTWVEGQLFAELPFVDGALCQQLGHALGEFASALKDFSHPKAQRKLKWDLRQSAWIEAHIDELDDASLRQIVADAYAGFEAIATPLAAAPASVIHNDANDYNVLVAGNANERSIGLIDLGDMCHTAIVGEVAIAATYAAMHLADPLLAIDQVVAGFHASHALSERELALIVPLIKTRLAVSIINASVQQRLRPDDPYVTISQAGATKLLRFLHGRDEQVACERLRSACGLKASANPQRIAAYLREQRDQHAGVLATAHSLETAAMLDLSFASTTGGDNPLLFDAEEAAHRIHKAMRDANTELAIGRYAEPRPLYTDAAFGDHGPISDRRTVHLGIDVFAPAGTEVMSPLPGHVHDTEVCEGHLDYGGLVILRHQLPDGTVFGTLYGHLDPESIAELCPGQAIDAGESFASLGSPQDNGGWPPHLHLQVLAADPARLPDVPRGVADPDDLEWHLRIYPDPSDLLALPDDRAVYRDRTAELRQQREQRFAHNLKTSYAQPIALVRGYGHAVFDSQGRKYLDAYNNVPHVGHCHPHVTRAVHEQTALLATNTRYLHEGMQGYADRLRELLPSELSVFFFTPSGSEANELALRLIRKHTGARDICVMDHGYHGNTTGTMAMSPYKFRQPGAPPKPDWVHVTVQPDTYRGAHQGADAGARYAAEVASVIEGLTASGRKLAGYLCECLPSVGGQMELPEGFLAAVYQKVREAGGLCIADDVQTGLWRTGTHAFGFQMPGVVPDLLVLGKPLGNGFPLGAVVTTPEVAASFANGPEFFSTFGGSTVAMAAGTAVLDVLRDENLADNARVVGDQLLQGLRELQERYELIGDVRGRGFFLGVELVEDRTTKQPATAAASHIKNYLRKQRILIGTDGPHDNVLKIRPPMSFDRAAADCLLAELGRALASLQ